MAKDIIKEYFACKSCGNMQFRKEYIFSMQSQTVAARKFMCATAAEMRCHTNR
ncbi:hypothetical protein LCGC14_2107040 [marine sediment metagenome]|uniref:Uncharacterized protein n=1 Tax=marine sediment metagenome TaxID=412755 RepID=A0A0F9E850_9ZZZZ